MDLLDRYQQQKGPDAQQQVIYSSGFETGEFEGGAIVKLLVKLSGGKIQSTRSANIVMIFIAGILFIAAIWVIFPSSSPRRSLPEKDPLTPASGNMAR